MIVKILKASATFKGVIYNFNKVKEGNAEFLGAVNFDALQGLNEIRQADYVRHLEAVSALNKGISEPQFHATISVEGKSHDKAQLAKIAAVWMEGMGYGKQPYLVFFHKDTDNNHIHIVSTRVDQEGKKINSGFERIRAVNTLNQITGQDVNKNANEELEKAKSYRFSNIAQFKLILERKGYTIKDNDLIKFGKKLAVVDFTKIEFRDPDRQRANQLRAIFKKYSADYDTDGLADYLKTKMGIELVFHAKDGKPAYGYTVIDHAQKNVYKGGEIMPMKEFTGSRMPAPEKIPLITSHGQLVSSAPDTLISINIARDVDDETVHGRRRKKKARNNQR